MNTLTKDTGIAGTVSPPTATRIDLPVASSGATDAIQAHLAAAFQLRTGSPFSEREIEDFLEVTTYCSLSDIHAEMDRLVAEHYALS